MTTIGSDMEEDGQEYIYKVKRGLSILLHNKSAILGTLTNVYTETLEYFRVSNHIAENSRSKLSVLPYSSSRYGQMS